jgi:hypothetical protein
MKLQNLKKAEGYMLQDRLKWNEKYETDRLPDEPSSIVKQFFKLAAGKKRWISQPEMAAIRFFWRIGDLRSMPLIFPMRA